MSGYLWKSYLEDDIESFRAVLASANTSYKGSATHKSGHNALLSTGSYEQRGVEDALFSTPRSGHKPHAPFANVTLSRADLNRRDGRGRTLLHLAASSRSETALDFAQALLDHPHTDIYLQDAESGWTALHRAFYEGNLAVAIAILTRDMQDAYGTAMANTNHPGGLIRIKDHEGNGPFDVLEQTYEEERMVARCTETYGASDSDDSDEEITHGQYDIPATKSAATTLGKEIFSFGSNKNLNLGFGDEDDRAYPERVSLTRPPRLIQHFWQAGRESDVPLSANLVPFHIQHKPIIVRDVQIGKYSSAILTADPFSNLHMCGHGSNGRLGLGDQRTRFHFTCVDGGALADQDVAAVALGNHHTLALTRTGAVFSWGSNMHGQLGYALAKASKNEEPAQLLPKQIFNPIKKEFVCGIATSASHSVLHTRNDLYTFGKNDGQLGIIDAEARSLTTINTPRKVGGNKFSSAIDSVSAVDHATICLLANREVWVYANYGYMRLTFPSTFLPNHFLRTSFVMHGAQSSSAEQRIVKIASGGDTIAALTSAGTIFTLAVSRPTLTAQDVSSSTTNPAKIRGALSHPVAVWSNRKTRLAARDVAVDQNGSVILATQAGSVWRRVKRAKIKDASANSAGVNKAKDYKFSRISGLTSISAVRASGYGAYAAIRRDSRNADAGNPLPPKTLRQDLLAISPFAPDRIVPEGRLLTQLVQDLPRQKNMEAILKQMFSDQEASSLQETHVMMSGKTPDVRIPVHRFLLAACSRHLHDDLLSTDTPRSRQPYEVTSVDGFLSIHFPDLDLISLTNLTLYIHCGHIMLISRLSCAAYQQWNKTEKQSLISIASQLQIAGMTDTIRNGPSKTGVYRNALQHFHRQVSGKSRLLPGADARIMLSDGTRELHSALICQRSEFFKALFNGGQGGRWLGGRSTADELVQIDLSHASCWSFDKFLRWAYSDDDEALFNDVVADDVEDYTDKIVEVMSLANELMVKPLSEICQIVLARQVTARNVCQILIAVAPAQVETLKQICLDYIFFNLEAVLRHGQLDLLEEDLLQELDDVAQSIQQSRSVISRTGQLEEDLFRRHPELDARIAIERQGKIDSIMILNKYSDMSSKGPSSYRAGSFHDDASFPASLPKTRRRSSNHDAPKSPNLPENKMMSTDLMFTMDNEDNNAKVSAPAHKHADFSKHGSAADVDAVGKRVLPTPVENVSSMAHANSLSSNVPSVSSPSAISVRSPWRAEALPTTKLGMREILDQASASRVSSLSLGLSKTNESASSISVNNKLSQKDRKRLQRQASQLTATGLSTSSAGTPVNSSPWKPIPKSQNVLATPEVQNQSASPSTPQLTMRQTVANPASSKSSIQKHTTSASPGVMSVQNQRQSSQSTAAKAPAQRVSSSTLTPSTPTLQPHSIRHTPRPIKDVSLPEHISMSEILNQQQFDKLIAAGGGGKRSLTDIQTEQEFQEWWDKESARIQDEGSNATREDKGRRGGRGGRRGRAGRSCRDPRADTTSQSTKGQSSKAASGSKTQQASSKQ